MTRPTASKACLDIIKRHEDEPGFLAGVCSKLEAYLCPAQVWTIAWGHTMGVQPGDTCTAEQADAFLQADVAEVEVALGKVLPATLDVTQGQWDALVSLCYNLAGGPRVLPRKAPHLWAALLAGNKQEAAHEFLDIDKADVDGVMTVLAGLQARRIDESVLFLS